MHLMGLPLEPEQPQTYADISPIEVLAALAIANGGTLVIPKTAMPLSTIYTIEVYNGPDGDLIVKYWEGDISNTPT